MHFSKAYSPHENNTHNRVDPDRRAPIEAYSSGSTLFAIKNDRFKMMYFYSRMYFKSVLYLCKQSSERQSPDGRAPIGARLSGIAMFAIEIYRLLVYICVCASFHACFRGV